METLFISVSRDATGQTAFLPHGEAAQALADTLGTKALSRDVLLAAQSCGASIVFRPTPQCTPDQIADLQDATLGRWQHIGDVAARIVSNLKQRG